MKKNTDIAVLLLALAGVTYFHFSERVRFKAAKAKYEARVAAADAAWQAAQGRLAALSDEIKARNEANAALLHSISIKNAEKATLLARIAALEGAEPSQPELETEPLVISLRAQVRSWKEAFSLSEAASLEKDEVIRNWEVKFDSQVKITMEWVARYESEHALRLASVDLFKMSQRQSKKSKLIYGAIAVAGVAYGMLK